MSPMVAPENSAERLLDVLVVERGRERRAHEVRRGEEPLHPAPHRIARRRLRVDAERPRRDDRHQVVLREHHRGHGAVAGRQVGEPFHVAAGELVRVLHHQHVDPARRHGGAHGRPAPLQLGGRDRADQPFGHVGHCAFRVPDWLRRHSGRSGFIRKCVLRCAKIRSRRGASDISLRPRVRRRNSQSAQAH